MENKTNVERYLDKNNISYRSYAYEVNDDHVDGLTVAQKLGKQPDILFKTLVTTGKQTCFVFVLAANDELDLKKAAKIVHEKSLAMIHVKDLLKLTGYVRGGCSPFLLKKPYQVTFSETALSHDTIILSAGKIGHQIEIDPRTAIALLKANVGDIIE